MKILINGTSINLGPHTWPAHLQKKFDCEIVNLSRGYAGNNYILNSTIAEISERSYDLVIVHWSNYAKIDFKTKYNIRPVDGHTLYNPNYDLLQLDWLLGEQPIEDTEIAEKAKNLIACYDDLCNDRKVTIPTTLNQVISLQSILKSQNIPYIFGFYVDWTTIFKTRYPNLCNLIDWNNMYDQYIQHIGKDNGWWDAEDGEFGHPSEEAHKFYADILYQHLSTKNLIKT